MIKQYTQIMQKLHATRKRYFVMHAAFPGISIQVD
jgi:hypothetical protein